MELFSQLAIIFVIAAALGIIMSRLRQPAILGYILAGVVAASFNILHHQTGEILTVFGEIGVTLLLFLVGMELSWPKIQSVGKTAITLGLGQIGFTFTGGLILASILGFNLTTSAYLAIALTFSSTIIIVKLLGEKQDLQSLYGRVSVGMLLVQDFAAILILILLTGSGAGQWSGLLLVELLAKFILLIIGIILISQYLMPWLVKQVAYSTELLFLTTVAWGVGFAAITAWEPIGFSIEVGGFVAGITLANAIEQHQILSRIRPLRDFFITIFFVSLGSGITFDGAGEYIIPVILLSLFVLIGNPFIVMIILRQLNYRARTGFLTSLTVAQISEFSLIVIALGMKLGQLNETIISIVTLVGVITMTVSTYLILNSEKIWRSLRPWLINFQKKQSRDLDLTDGIVWENHIVLIGCQRTGRMIWQRIKKKNENVLIIDFNPDNVRKLADEGAHVLYGDIEDIDNLEYAALDQAKMIISTVSDYEATLLMLEYLKTHPRRGKLTVIVTADFPEEAEKFYHAGADYVVIPRWITGLHLADLVAKHIKRGKTIFKKWVSRERKALVDQQ